MTTLFFHNRSIPVPTSLNELTPKQLLGIIKVMRLNLDPYVALWKIVFILLNFDNRLWLKWFFLINIHVKPLLGRLGFSVTVYEIDDDALDELLQVANFLYEDDKPLTTNLFPVINHRRFQLFGPKNQILDLTFRDFRFAETRFLMYHKTHEIDSLNELVAVLYPVVRRNGSNAHLSDENLLKSEQCAAQVPFYTKQAILLFYDGCRKHLIDKHKNIFPKKAENKPKTELGISYRDIVQQSKSWEKAITKYASDPVRMEAIDAAPIWNVMKKLDYDIEQDAIQKREIEKIKSK